MLNGLEEKLRGAKILIVDDNPVNIRLLQETVEHAGYSSITTATDPRDVEGLFDSRSYDLILLDIRMPHMDGFEVMDILSKKINDDYLPVIVLTAQTDEETKLKALEKGAKDFITKPFHRVEVLQRIRNMLEVRTLYKQQKNQAEILDAKVRERTQELRETQNETIRRLGRAGEYRDNETGMHVIRMSKCCHLLALAANIDPNTAELILHASPMHDLGKIGIPDNVLLKPGKLNEDEWKTMKTHAQIGADILAEHSSPIMGMAESIALTHHEKWDGSGYPQGLTNSTIPIEGRIAAISDVFDALTSARPYKEAWSAEKAIAVINQGSGSHFDPDLVKLFNDIVPEVLRLRDKYHDEGGD
jgi:putative two-component system response regulator